MANDQEDTPGKGDNFDPETGEVIETYEEQDEDEEAKRQRIFPNFILQMRHGHFSEVLGDKLGELIRRLREEAENRGKSAATFTLKLSLLCNDDGQLTVKPDYTIKEPKLVNGDSIFWTSSDGGVHASDPRQVVIDFKRLKQNSPAKKVSAPTQTAKRADAPSQKPRKL